MGKPKPAMSVRVHENILTVCRATGIDFARIVESCALRFACMSDDERVEFLRLWDPSKIATYELRTPLVDIGQRARDLAVTGVGTQATHMTEKQLLSIGLLLWRD